MKLRTIINASVSLLENFYQTAMNNLEPAPKKTPLILILIGTTLLAIPAAFGTLALFDTSSVGIGVDEPSGQILFCISLSGFALHAGYILTTVFKRHNAVFWLCSAIYNFGLSCCYQYFFLAELNSSLIFGAADIFSVWLNPAFLISLWTIFVTIASGYYFNFAVRRKNQDLL